MAIFSRFAMCFVALMLALALFLPISVQAASQPTYGGAAAQANAQKVASHFATSTVNPGRSITDSETGKSTFFIGSVSQKVTSKTRQAATPVQATPVQAATEKALVQAISDRSNMTKSLNMVESDVPPSAIIVIKWLT